ncbi:hypothetical protein JW964_00675 [candidate division KSB1 bacterium]|nr:hypothetical protein [candidate division KSB1 bacterium]
MFTILKSEINYHYIVFIIYLSAMLLTGFLGHIFSIEMLSSIFFIMIFVFVMLQNWFSLRNKEKRELLLARLPIPLYKLGLNRIIAVHIAILIGIICYLGFFISKTPQNTINYSKLLEMYTLLIFGFSIYFISRDLLFVFFRKLGVNAQRILIGIFLIGLGVNFITLIAIKQIKQTGSTSHTIFSTIDYLVCHHFFQGFTGIVQFIFIIVVFSGITILSFNRRKAYLE